MRVYSTKQIFTVFAATFCILVIALAGTAAAKSVYLIADHHTAQFDGWEQKPDGTVDHQATYNLISATDPAGVAIWEDPNSDAAYLFVTSEFSLAGVELVDADTMMSIGTASAPYSNLAGIDIDRLIVIGHMKFKTMRIYKEYRNIRPGNSFSDQRSDRVQKRCNISMTQKRFVKIDTKSQNLQLLYEISLSTYNIVTKNVYLLPLPVSDLVQLANQPQTPLILIAFQSLSP